MPRFTVYESVGYAVEAETAEEAVERFMQTTRDNFVVVWREVEDEVYSVDEQDFVPVLL